MHDVELHVDEKSLISSTVFGRKRRLTKLSKQQMKQFLIDIFQLYNLI